MPVMQRLGFFFTHSIHAKRHVVKKLVFKELLVIEDKV